MSLEDWKDVIHFAVYLSKSDITCEMILSIKAGIFFFQGIDNQNKKLSII